MVAANFSFLQIVLDMVFSLEKTDLKKIGLENLDKNHLSGTIFTSKFIFYAEKNIQKLDFHFIRERLACIY